MPATLHDYAENNPPRIRATKPLLHPNNRTKVIGHLGLDEARDLDVATFPRRKEEHWFRGDSTSGLTGYGISQTVLDHLTQPAAVTPDSVLIIETDTGRVIEYDIAAFSDATVVAYSPELNESVIGDETMRVDDDTFHDRQRVLPVSEAKQTFDREDVIINQ